MHARIGLLGLTEPWIATFGASGSPAVTALKRIAVIRRHGPGRHKPAKSRQRFWLPMAG